MNMISDEVITGPGPCPLCGADTVSKTNKSLKIRFYGCSRFPVCKGSRDDCHQYQPQYKKVDNKEHDMSLTMNNVNNKMMDRFFKKVDGVVWDLMSGKVGIQSVDGISTLEWEGEDAQVSLNMLDQFGMPVPAFAQSTPVEKVKKGDLIYVNNKPKGWVIEVKTGKGDLTKFGIMSPEGSSSTWTPPKVAMFGLESGVMVLKSLIEMLPAGEEGLSGMQGNLMPLMMMGGDGGDMEKIMPMMLMSQMGGMGGAGAGAGANNMIQMMMMAKMMGKGGGFGGGFFE